MHIEPWAGNPKSLSEWLERLDLTLGFNGTAKDKHTHALAATIGPTGYSSLKSIFGDKLLTTEYEEAKKQLKACINPPKLIMLERISFYNMVQQQETAAAFLSRIQIQARMCSFPDGTMDFLVRDRFMMGLKSEKAKAAIAEAGADLSAADALAKVQTLAEVAAVKHPSLHSTVNATQRSRPTQRNSKDQKCSKCTLRGHISTNCTTECRYCKKIGHIEKQCRGKKRAEAAVSATVTEAEIHTPDPVTVEIEMKRGSQTTKKRMQVDTGSEITLIQANKISKLLNECDDINNDLSTCEIESDEVISFRVANGEREQARKVWVSVCAVSQPNPGPQPHSPSLPQTPSRKGGGPNANTPSRYRLPLFVTDNKNTPSLLGRSWMKVLYPELWNQFSAIKVCSIDSCTSNDPYSKFREEVFGKDCFSEGVGTVEGVISLDWKAQAVPKFHRARDIPFSIKKQVDTEIDRLVAEGTWRPINSSAWASPMVPVRKSDSTVRLCGDYKSGVNPALDCTVYPIPGLEECLEGMHIGLYTKLDVKQAYNSLVLCEEDQAKLCINTHRGLFAPVRLPFGVSSAGGIWQRTMDQIIGQIPGTKCRVDDIIITAPTVKEHMERVREVVDRLSRSGLKCRREKCHVMVDTVEYLGYKLTPHGIVPMEERTKALSTMPPPDNYQQLRSFIGAASYYRRFVPHFSEVIQPLLDLEKEDFKWEAQHQKSFDLIKDKLTHPPSLVPYDQRKQVVLATDASSYALGAVLSHPGEEEVMHPVEFISRKLTGAEQRYSMVEKEALAIVWAVKRFHRYLYGREFEIKTDHRALQFIFSPEKNLPVMTVSRIARWAIILQNYCYSINYEQVPHADVLSRLVKGQGSSGEEVERSGDCCDDPLTCVCYEELTCLFLGNSVKWRTSAADIARETKKDPVLSQILALIRQGTPAPQRNKDKKLSPYLSRLSQGQLTVNLGCVMWGHRVCVPETLQDRVVEQIHSAHPGIDYSKRIARGYVWWPGIDDVLEQRCKSCQNCVEASKRPAYTVQPWPASRAAWERAHADLFQWEGKDYFLIVDSYSNWIDVIPVSSTTSSSIIRVLTRQFQNWGLPDILVTDNGPQLISEETEAWLKERGVHHPKSPPYNQRSNGLAECYVDKVKRAFKKGVSLDEWILQHNNTPIHGDGSTPAERFVGRKLRTPLAAVNPLYTPVSEPKQHNTRAPQREFEIGQEVYYRDINNGKWIPDIVESIVSQSVIQLKTAGRRHVDHIIDRSKVSKPVNLTQSQTP